jgi:hypothetical protein
MLRLKERKGERSEVGGQEAGRPCGTMNRFIALNSI